MLNTLTSWLQPSPRRSRRRGKTSLNSVEQLESRIAPNATPHVLSSGDYIQNWSNTGLISANHNWSNVPSVEGFGGDFSPAPPSGTNPQTILGEAGPLTVHANHTDPNATFDGVVELQLSTNPTVALNATPGARAPYLVFHLDTSRIQGILVRYNLRDLTSIPEKDTVTQVALQYRIGNSGNFIDLPAGYVADATQGGTATKVTPVSVTLPTAADNQSLVQVRVITAEASGIDEIVGVDDIRISGSDLPIQDIEPNNTQPGQTVTVASGDILTTPVEDWTTIAGSINSGTDVDFFTFTLTSQSGVFFDIDSRDTGLSTTLNSILTLFSAGGVQLETNDDGYDFQGFAVPDAGGGNGLSPDSSLYFDLAAGTYSIRVSSAGSTTGDYELRILADSIYSATAPVLNSLPGASDTVYLDFDGHAATDGWGTYNAMPYDLDSNPGTFSPAERLAIFNVWQMVSEDYSPFALNVSTATPGTLGDGVGHRQVFTNSDGTIVDPLGAGVLGIAFLQSYAGGAGNNNVSFTFAANFSYLGSAGGTSGRIVAYPVEMGNTTSHEFGHALGLRHYSSSTIPGALMATPDFGLNRERWAAATSIDTGTLQDDMAIISGVGNTIGYRTDDHGSSIGSPRVLTAVGSSYTANGIIEQITDTDVFQFVGFGATTIRVDVSDYINNLDLVVRLLDSTGTPISTSDSATSFDALITANLPSGIYFVEVRGTGAAGIAGQYSLRIDLASNAPPVIALPGGPLNYTENGPAAILDAGATLADPDSPDLDGGALTVDFSLNGSGDDRLEIRNQGTDPGQIGVSGSNVTFGGTVIGTFTGGTGTTPLVVNFNASATPAAAEALLRNITFRNVSDTPSTLPRTVRVVVSDGDGGVGSPVVKTVNVTAVNDAPVITLTPGAASYSEGTPAIILDAAATVVDPDSADLDTGILTVDYSANGTADDRLAIRNEGTTAGLIGVSGSNVTFGGTVIGTFTGGTGTAPLVVTLNAAATPVAIQALFRNITFENVSTNPSTLSRQVRFVLTDGDGGTSTAAIKTVTILAINANPVLSLPGGAATYTENGPAAILDPGATVADSDSPNFDTGTLTVDHTAGVAADDRLEIRNEGTAAGLIGVSGSNVTYSGTTIGTFTGGTGATPLVVTFNADAALVAVEALVRNITFRIDSDNPLTSPRTVQFVVTDGDGGTSSPVTKIVNVVPINDGAAVSLPSTPATFTEGGSAVIVDGSAAVSDVDSTDFNGGSLTVDYTANGTADDRLAIRNEGTGAGLIGVSGSSVTFGGAPIGTFTGGTGTTPLVVTFTSTAATPAAVTTLARNILFSNVSDNASLAPRSVRFVVNDGDGAPGAPATQIVNIAAMNDPPVVSFPGGPVIYTENNPPVVLDPGATVADPDSADFDTGTLTVRFFANGTADDRLEILNLGVAAGQIGVSGLNVTFGGVVIGTFTGGVGTTDLVVTFNSAASRVAVETLVRHIAFHNVSGNPATPPRTIDLVLTDGDGGTSATVSKIVTVVPINDEPTLSFPGTAATFTEGGPPVFVNTNAVVADPDSPDFGGGTLTVNYAAGGTASDILAIANEGTAPGQIGVAAPTITFGGVVIGTFTGGDGTNPLVLSLNAASSPAAVQALIRNITFFNGTEDPSPATRTLRFVLTDGDGGTSDATTTTININSVPDLPVLVLPGPSLNYVENDSPTVIDSGATLSDIDSPNFDSGSLAVTLILNGTASDRLTIWSQGTGPGQIGISGTDVTYNPGTGAVVIGVITGDGVGLTPLVVTFSNPAATIAAVQALVRTVAFSNVSDTPSTASRSVRFVVNDGDGGTSLPVSKTVTVTATNEAPILAAANNLAGIDEDPAVNPGTLVPALIAGQVTDPDGPASGIAVAAVDDTNGTWQYALDGTTFNPIASQLAAGNVLLLGADADTRVRFVPNPNFNGSVAGLTFRAWDQSAGIEGASINPFPEINPTGSLSATTAVAGITIASVLDTPSVTGATTNEDTQSTGGLVVTRNAGDGAEVTHFKITGITGGLLFKNDGTTPIANGDFLTAAEAGAGLKFTPASNLNSANTPFFGFSVQSSLSASDAGLGGGLAVATVTVNAVNDDPVVGAIGDNGIYLAGEAPLVIDGDGAVADIDSPDFDGGSLTVSFSAGGQTSDVLSIRNMGTGAGQIGLSGLDVTYESVVIGTLSGGTGGSPLVVTLDADATLAAVQALIRNVAFSTSGTTISGDRTIQFRVADGDGGTSNAPTATVNVVSEMDVVSILRNDPTPTPASTASWTVTFSLPVMGVTAANFTLTGSLGATSTIDSVTGSGTTWTITAMAGGTGDGTLGLDFTSEIGLNLTATNEPFTGEVYDLDRTGPTVTFDDGDVDDLIPAGSTLTYTLTFSEPIDAGTVRAADLANVGTAAITLGAVQVTGPTTVTVEVTPTTGGTLQLGLASTAVIADLLGNPVIVPTADDTTVTVDAVLLAVANIDDGDADDIVAPNETLVYTIDFAEPIDFSAVDAADFANLGSSTATFGVIRQVDPDTITIAVTPTTPGTLILQVGPDITDLVGNPMSGPAADGDTVIVNVPPVAGPETYSAIEDTQLVVDAATGLLANDTDANDPPASLTVDTTPVVAPANGTLALQADGSFTYTPNPDFNGVDTFTYRVRDPQGGTALGTVTINVAPVNDAPTITVPATPVTVNEDAGLQTIPNFATGIATGPANESAQVVSSLVLTVTGTTGNLAFSSNPAINPATGTLTFFTAPDTIGTATVQVVLTDSGIGIAPNVNSTTWTFTIVVNPVNDAPTFQLPGVAPTVLEDTGEQVVPGFVTNFQPGPATAADESGQTPAYIATVTATSGALGFSVPPAIAPDGTLTYTPAPNAFGTATVEVLARDSGGTGNGGQDVSAARTFTISVTPVNDPPTAVDDTATVVRGSGPTTINVMANDSIAPDAGESLVGLTAVTQPTNGRVTMEGTAVTYEPRNGFVGTDTFQYTVRDSNGGTATSTVEVTVVLPPSETPSLIAVGSGPGGGSRVRLYILPTGTLAAEFSVYDSSFTGAISVAVGDINGDSIPDVIVVAGAGGGPHVKVIDGSKPGLVEPDGRISDAALLGSFFAYSPGFSGGVILTVSDVNGDGCVDIITGTGDGGGAHVKVIDGASIATGSPATLASFFSYQPSFRGGVNVAAGDVNGDGITDVITAAGASGGSHVKAFDGSRLAQAGPGDSDLLASFFAYGADFLGGVNIAAGDVDGDGRSDIITGAGLGGGSHVKVFSGGALEQFASFFAFPGSVGPGVDLAFRAPTGSDPIVVVGAGQGARPRVQTFTGLGLEPTVGFDAFDPGFLGGVDVG